MKEQIEKLKALVELGDKATQGEYRVRRIPNDLFVEAEKTKPDHPYHIEVLGEDVDGEIYTLEQKENHAEFITASANARKELKELIEYTERLERFCEAIIHNYPSDQINHEDFRVRAFKEAKQAISEKE